MVTRAHPWKLVAPWWKWARAAHPADGRVTPPAILKFAGDEFVKDFIADPQHSLAYDAQVDVVSNLDAAGVAEGWIARAAARVSALDTMFLPRALRIAPKTMAGQAALLAATREAPSFLRKLFQPAHDRHYLVACELHCDIPGFPSVDRAQLCQAGFVVRRRLVDIGDVALARQAEERAGELADAEAGLGELESLNEDVPDLGEENARIARRDELRAAAPAASWPAYLQSQRDAVEEKRARLGDWFREKGLDAAVQGWVPGTGWRTLSALEERSDTVHRLKEQFFPLVPLLQDPRARNQDARGRTMYYGVVPAVLAEHDPQGNARFDHQHTYEIRCFVRRHDASRPRTTGAPPPDCCGEVTWSEPTQRYRLAPPFDLVGTSQRPVTIQMPDLRELAAQVKKRPRGKLSPVKFVQPQHMSPSGVGIPTTGTMGGPAICFFSIPLITIIALFVLNIFLPIVVLIFNLWFLLALRFCIMPQLSLSGGVDAALKVKPPGIDLAAGASLRIDGTDVSGAALKDQLADFVHGALDQEVPGKAPSAASLAADVGVDDLAGLGQAFADNAALPDYPGEPAPPNLGYRDDLRYEPRREPQWSIALEGRA